jgi:hypothetical protein
MDDRRGLLRPSDARQANGEFLSPLPTDHESRKTEQVAAAQHRLGSHFHAWSDIEAS